MAKNKRMIIKGEIVTLTKPRKVIFKKTEIDAGKIKSLEIIAKTVYSAISPGTEIAAYSGEPPLRPGPIYPRVVGYCNVAEVLKKGKSVKKVRVGDFILTNESHRTVFLIPEEKVLARLSKKTDLKEATLTYLYNLGLNSLKTIKLKEGMVVAVIGLGVLGLGAVEQAKILKLNILAFSDSQYKLKLAKKLGAQRVVLKSKANNMENVADLVITTSNSWADWQLALKLAKSNGAISVLGFPGRGKALPNFNPLEPQYFYFKKIVIIPAGLPWGKKDKDDISNSNKRNCRNILNSIKNKELNPELLMSGIYNYKDIELVYKKIMARDNKSITFVLKWQ